MDLYRKNFYGQLTEGDIKNFRIIIDNAQAYFQEPLPDVDTLYTCRKFFGVSDGGILFTDTELLSVLPVDISFDRMHFLLGRYELTAADFYDEYVKNNKLFANQGVKRMSKLTQNLLHGIDYDYVCRRRNENYALLDKAFRDINNLKLKSPKGAFAYPLFIKNGAVIRKRLIDKKIYIPCLWPNVLLDREEHTFEYELANNVLPLPVDQRYGDKEMRYLIEMVNESIS